LKLLLARRTFRSLAPNRSPAIMRDFSLSWRRGRMGYHATHIFEKRNPIEDEQNRHADVAKHIEAGNGLDGDRDGASWIFNLGGGILREC